jgi:regulator of RNase E activity RraA
MASVFERLRKIRSPIVYDAIERFDVRSRQEGYSDGTIHCLLPSLGAFVGYAVTGRIMAEVPHADGSPLVSWEEVWNAVSAAARPSIMVCQDMDQPAGRGCAWGDVSASIFRRLGCDAVVTNGSARDIRQVESLGFGLFARGPVVGHANVRFVSVGGPVKVGGLVIAPGDIVHADEHGVVTIPKEIDLGELVRVADEFVASEARVIAYARSAADFSIAGLKQAMDRHDASEYRQPSAEKTRARKTSVRGAQDRPQKTHRRGRRRPD